MTNDEFKSLLFDAGFKTKKDLSEFLGLHYTTTTKWGKDNPYPTWLKPVLEWAIKAKKYDDLQDFFKAKND